MSGIIAGVAVSAIGTGLSFAQAASQRKLSEAAQREADAAMKKARERLDVNYAEGQSIKKEGYELESDANLAAGAQAMIASVEGDARGGAATAGRVLASQNQAQAQTRVAMGDELTNIETSIMEEDSRLRDLNVSLDLEEVAGNQQKAADAERKAAAAQKQGVQQAVQTAGAAVSAFVPLFQQKTQNQIDAAGAMSLSPEQYAKFGNVKGGSMGEDAGKGFTNLDFDKVKDFSRSEFKDFKSNLTAQQTNMLFKSKQYLQNYNSYPSLSLDDDEGNGVLINPVTGKPWGEI